MNNLIDKARHLPVSDAVTTISISPVTLPVSGRGVPLELRITMPMTGSALPIVLLSHGHGPSLYLPSKDGYAPLANFLAEQGFVVIQPTHLNSKVAGLPADAPGGPLFWHERVEDMTGILDQLDVIEAMVPAIAGRFDHQRIAAVGHSLGGHTVSILFGATIADPNDAAFGIDMRDPRIMGGVLLAAPGGGEGLSDPMRSRFPALALDFTAMTTAALVVFGDADSSPHLTERGAKWHAEPYHQSPGANALLTVFEAGHGLGGIAGYDAKETDDEDPDRLAVTLRMVAAYLGSTLYPNLPIWSTACAALMDEAGKLGRIDVK